MASLQDLKMGSGVKKVNNRSCFSFFVGAVQVNQLFTLIISVLDYTSIVRRGKKRNSQALLIFPENMVHYLFEEMALAIEEQLEIF